MIKNPLNLKEMLAQQFEWVMKRMKQLSMSEALQALTQGQCLIYPTESVYGLGCDVMNENALTTIGRLKQRPQGKCFIVLIADVHQALPWVDGWGQSWLLDHADCLEGTTWVLPASACLPRTCQLNGEVALRVSAHPQAKALCREFGRPIVSTSANLSGQQPIMSQETIPLSWHGHVAGVLTGQPLGRPVTKIIHARSGRVIRG